MMSATGFLSRPGSSVRRLNGVCALLIVAALLALIGADIEIYPVDPWEELSRIGLGLIRPGWTDLPALLQALGQTIAFALLAVALAAPWGWRWRWRIAGCRCGCCARRCARCTSCSGG
ncbi:hypothetical protein [Marinobacterium aestuariivivens]|uniref:ABC transmembrane type-1 domain-containing protein n=1 Tax=Marinobacterium aestuariivivens TaxID=1698799 RepID=A0ABW1ZV75_9GAMM